jgi:mono/diheme cytochrome c family protein
MMTLSTPALLLAALFAASGGAPGDPDTLLARMPDPGPDVSALFVEHCAKCHGEKGDGQGTTALDRPARSFLGGGFSYGNTRDALVRSIRHGIPGTPMPAFPDEVLTAAQRDALADFVIAFGPPGTVVEPGASVLRVEDRPVVVRGMLPPLVEGDVKVPRGLLVGFPTGTTFEYRVDDVRLRALRQGEFVDRRDWGDRGGLELRPLGQVLRDLRAVTDGYDAESADWDGRRALRGTEVIGSAVVVRYDLLDPRVGLIGRGEERLRVVDTVVGPVPTRALRHFQIDGSTATTTPPTGARVAAAFRGPGGTVLHVHQVDASTFRVAVPDGAGHVVHLVYAERWSPALETLVTLEATR